MKSKYGLAIILSLLCIGSSSLASSDQKKSAAAVIGTWRLQAITRITPEGKEIPWCTLPSGLITYTPWGYMSATINCDESTPADAPARAYSNMLLYSGTYKLVQNGKAVSHHVLNASHKNIIGKELVRSITSLKGRKLILDGKSANDTGTVRVEWEKVTPLNRTGAKR